MMQSSPLTARRAIIWTGRFVLGCTFVYAGFSKLLIPNNAHLWPMFFLKFSISMNISVFAQQVESYKLISPEASQLVAHTLPFVEIVLGLLLLIGWRLANMGHSDHGDHGGVPCRRHARVCFCTWTSTAAASARPSR